MAAKIHQGKREGGGKEKIGKRHWRGAGFRELKEMKWQVEIRTLRRKKAGKIEWKWDNPGP